MVDPRSEIAADVSIGPFCVVEAGAVIEEGCQLGSHVVIKTGTWLGKNNAVSEAAILGGRPQHLRAGPKVGKLRIGENNSIREHVTIHCGLGAEDSTVVGDHNLIMVNAHVAHDCTIGNNVNISQDCQLMLSVVGDGAFLPFRAALFMTTFMDNSMVAQNTCLQMCVVGRNTFIGAGCTFTDFNLLPAPIRALDGSHRLSPANRPVLGGCVGHNCRLGAGMVVFPARTIESDVVLFASEQRRVIDRDIRYEDSDHHRLAFAQLHPRLYPRLGEALLESW